MKARFALVRTYMSAKEHSHSDITTDVFYKNRFTKTSFALLSLIMVFSINTFCLYLYLVNVLSILWVINAVHFLTVAVFAAGVYFLPYHMRHYGLNTEHLLKNICIGLGIGSLGLLLACWNRYVMMQKGYEIYKVSITAGSLLNLLILYPLVAFFQELIIKGYLQTILVSILGKEKIGKLMAIILSSLVFCQLHIHYNIYMPNIVLFAFFFSVITGYIYEKTRSVIGISVIHFLCGAGMTAFLTL